MNEFMSAPTIWKSESLLKTMKRKRLKHLKAFENFSMPLCDSDRSNLKQSVRYVRRRIEFLLCGSVPEILICLYRTCVKLYWANKQLTIKEWNSFINPNIFAREERESNWNPLMPAPFFAIGWRQSHYLLLYYLNYFYPCLTFSWHVFF